VEPNTIYDIKMLIPSAFDNTKYSIQGVWDTEGTVEFPFNGEAGIPGDAEDPFWATLILNEAGFFTVYCAGADGSVYDPKGD
jgi:hypothetical protein